MRATFILPLIAVELLGASLVSEANSEVESAYLASSSRREPFVQVADEHLISFEQDIDGDGKPEHFLTREGMRDGKQGYLWSIYSVRGDGAVSPIGEATFSECVFAPKPWSKDTKIHGFYTYGPGGAGKGILNFYAFDKGHITLLEERQVSPNGADKAEFDGLFGARLTGESPKIDLKRAALPKQQSSATPSSAPNPPSGIQHTMPAPKPPLSVQPPATKHAPESKPTPTTPLEEPTSSMPWSIIVVLIVTAGGLLWLLLKRRS